MIAENRLVRVGAYTPARHELLAAVVTQPTAAHVQILAEIAARARREPIPFFTKRFPAPRPSDLRRSAAPTARPVPRPAKRARRGLES
ncbi:MAG: hypothetical protein ACRDF0_01500 [Candidatus Limnocylindria bacterium]